MSYVDDSGQSGEPPLDELGLGTADADVVRRQRRRGAAPATEQPAPQQRTAQRPITRVLLGQSAYDFYGRRSVGLFIAVALVAVAAVGLLARGLDYGVDFEDGIGFDIPPSELSIGDVRSILDDNGVDGSHADVTERATAEGDAVKVRIDEEPAEVREALRAAFADAADVEPADVRVSALSASWGDEATARAALGLGIAVAVFLVVFLLRFRWQAAVAALVAVVHDVAVAAGVYALLGFEVSPASVVGVIAIAGYSLYDKLVAFDRVRDNAKRVAAAGHGSADLINVSANQGLARWLTASIAVAIPALTLIVVGLFSSATLRDLGIGLLIGLTVAAFSTMFVALPLYAMLRRTAAQAEPLIGEDLRTVVVRGVNILTPITGRRRSGRSGPSTQRIARTRDTATTPTSTERPQVTSVAKEQTSQQLLGRTPRPRKKKRR